MNAISPPILAEGIHLGVLEDAYHADPCAYPSLSSGVGRLILRSPMHARHAHPRLNPAHEARTPSKVMTEGTLLHRLILGVGADVRIVEADDWKKKASQKARDEALAAGQTPVLAHRYAELQDCADAAREQIGTHPEAHGSLHEGDPEATVVWRDGVALCRARPDFLKHDPRAPLIDLKTTSKSAAPEAWERSLLNDGYAFQAAFYLRGVERVRKVRPPGMWFVVVETVAPYAISVVTLAPSLMDLAERQVEEAIARWSECQRTGQWPGYPPYIAHVEAPAWMLNRADERALREEIMREHEMEAAE